MHLLIPAAGSGKRMGVTGNKLLLEILGMPIISWTLKAAQKSVSIEWVGIIGQKCDFPRFENILLSIGFSKKWQLIEGGETRQESVYQGLKSLPNSAKLVLIHDGARCLATPSLFDQCSDSLLVYSALIAAIAVKDTIKIVDAERYIADTPNREQLWAAQTPQGFSVDLLKECHAKAIALGWEVTDDAALFERCQLPVKIIEGEETNLKITTPVDLAIAEYILAQRID